MEELNSQSLIDRFRASMRVMATSVSLVTGRDPNGAYYGMAVTSWTCVSMDPPSVLVVVNRSASSHRIIDRSRCFCLNLMSESHSRILERFLPGDMRSSRFNHEQWRKGPMGLPLLLGAYASEICAVDAAYEYGSHTIFVGLIIDVVLPETSDEAVVPLIRMNGSLASSVGICRD